MLHSSDRRCSPGPRRSLMRTRPALWELALKRERLPRMPSAQSARPHGCCFGGVRRFVDDSHRPLDTNATEHALRCVVLGKITTARAPSTALRSPRGSTAWWKPSSPASNRIATSALLLTMPSATSINPVLPEPAERSAQPGCQDVAGEDLQ